jgi:hypothetical protein
MYVPILGVDPQTVSVGSLMENQESNFTNTSFTKLRENSYDLHGEQAGIPWKVSETVNDYMDALAPTRYITE